MMSTNTKTTERTDDGAVLSVKNVTKRFGGLVAVDDVSFEVPDGQILGLIGPNGAGKTTMFNVINGFLEPEEGSIIVNGTELTNTTPDVHAKNGMARTFQLVKPFGSLSVLENVMVGAFLEDRSRSAAEERAREVIEFLGLGDIADTPAENITVAEKKKMELCRALATNPNILLVDEIMAGLHEDEMDDLIETLEQINENGTTIILIEHVMDVIMDISERIIVLNEGSLIADAPPESISSNDEVIEAYLGQRWKEQQNQSNQEETDA